MSAQILRPWPAEAFRLQQTRPRGRNQHVHLLRARERTLVPQHAPLGRRPCAGETGYPQTPCCTCPFQAPRTRAGMCASRSIVPKHTASAPSASLGVAAGRRRAERRPRYSVVARAMLQARALRNQAPALLQCRCGMKRVEFVAETRRCTVGGHMLGLGVRLRPPMPRVRRWQQHDARTHGVVRAARALAHSMRRGKQRLARRDDVCQQQPRGAVALGTRGPQKTCPISNLPQRCAHSWVCAQTYACSSKTQVMETHTTPGTHQNMRSFRR